MKPKGSKYKGVSKHRSLGKYEYWVARTNHEGRAQNKYCKTEREAAKAYDIMMIQNGREPVNVLVRKTIKLKSA